MITLADMTLESALIAAIVTLAGVVGILWKIERGNVRELAREIKDCRNDRLELWKTIVAMEARACNVEDCPQRPPDTKNLEKAWSNVRRIENEIKDELPTDKRRAS